MPGKIYMYVTRGHARGRGMPVVVLHRGRNIKTLAARRRTKARTCASPSECVNECVSEFVSGPGAAGERCSSSNADGRPNGK